MEISLYTIILPRLEVFFLEEWIQHHLSLGINKIYIYDNGVSNIHDAGFNTRKSRSFDTIRVLTSEEVGFKWEKKPDADYYTEYSDRDIYNKLYGIMDKFSAYVELLPWKFGIQHNLKYPKSQRFGWIHCMNNNVSDWWLHIDPDEYIMLYKHDSLNELISSLDDVSCIRFKQKVFKQRIKDIPVRSIHEWGCILGNHFKSMIVKDIVEYKIHDPVPAYGKTHVLDLDVGLFHHYRGEPGGQGGPVHLKYKESQFDKIDNSMDKYSGIVRK